MSYNAIDSADLFKEMEELEESLKEHLEDGFEEDDFEDLDALEELRDVNEQGRLTYGDEWEGGLTLIEEDDFEEYARDFADDVFDIPDSISNYVDWESFSEDLKQDFQAVEYRGITYYVRD